MKTLADMRIDAVGEAVSNSSSSAFWVDNTVTDRLMPHHVIAIQH